MKNLFYLFLGLILATNLIGFSACNEVDVTERAQKAADEFCECYKDYSLEYCEKQFKKEYGTQPSNDFIDIFNARAKKCNIKLEKIYTGSSVRSGIVP